MKSDKKKEEELKRFYNQRSDKFTIVLNDNHFERFQSARRIYRRFVTSDEIGVVWIGVIKHDKDIDEETKHVKTPHYHVVLQLDKICRVQTMINKIMDLFECYENMITIDKCTSICMQARYLCHLDDFDKAQYFPVDVETNDKDVLERYYSLVIIRDVHDLIGVVKHYHYDLEEIMQHVAHYDKWRKYINDLIINYNRKMRL